MTYFTDKELACRCGCGMLPKLVTRSLLNRIREDYGKPIIVTSGARCAAYNRLVKGAPNSEHTKGNAVDLVRTQDLLDFLKARLEHYKVCMEDPEDTPGWLHIDTRERNGWRMFKP